MAVVVAYRTISPGRCRPPTAAASYVKANILGAVVRLDRAVLAIQLVLEPASLIRDLAELPKEARAFPQELGAT